MAAEPEVFGTKGSVGVVVVHDIFGRGDYVRGVGRDLAAAGFPSAVVDLFGGASPTTLEEAFALRDKLTPDGVLDALDAGREAVARRLVPHAPVGTLGFCMGGGYALFGACRRRFRFAVDFYGRIERADDVEGLEGPVLALLASEDERITPWAFAELLPAATRFKKRVTVELYPGVRHAFHRPGGETYNAAAAADAWARTLRFLEERTPPRARPA
ncbi:MAG TPA: dienelactone hydrolase family protein [Thermoplasmata archaeon]|nr:dienelactone hydrolase family protein [Thermoplasmata archaeon]